MKEVGQTLQGVTVLDFCHFLAGPYATMVLADLGADVIKVEDPTRPDEARSVGPVFQNGESLYFASLNRSKRSVGIQLNHPEGHRAALDLVRTADVVVDNFRPGVMAKLGLAHASLAALKPDIVTCSLSGYGETGPYAGRPGYDYTIQALAGVMSLTGEPDAPPGKAGISYVDHSGGLAAALAVCAALLRRDRTGEGTHLDVALLDVQMSMLTYLAAWSLNAGYQPPRWSNSAHPSIVPAQTFATGDGHLSVFVGHDGIWERLVSALVDDRLVDPVFATAGGRLEHRDRVIATLQEVFAGRPSSYWVELLTRHNVPCAPVNDLDAALRDPQVEARDMIQTATHRGYGDYRHVAGPFGATRDDERSSGASLLGEDTAQVLAGLGYDDGQIEALAERGVIARPLRESGS